METIAEFNDNQGLNVKLTKDKLYVSSLGSEETFALRGVNGVGIYDNILLYNAQVEEVKANKELKKFGVPLVIGGLALWVGGCTLGYGSLMAFFGPCLGFILLIVGGKFLMANVKEPVLDSKLNINMQGGEKSFAFNKTNDNASEIADFINKVEETLTAYN